jgi:glycosyltransferase involved in cell wall biosynthesis
LFVHQAAELYGSDKVLLYLIQGLLRQEVYFPIVALPKAGPLKEVLEALGVEVHVVPVAKLARASFSFRGFWVLIVEIARSILALNKVVAGRKISIVHSNTVAVLGGALWAALRRVPHVWHVHEIIVSPWIAQKSYPRILDWGSDHIVAISSATAQWLCAVKPSISKKMSVIFNGLPPTPQFEASETTQYRATLGIAPGQIVISLVGRINSWKGHPLLLNAATTLLARGSLGNARFLVVGDAAPGQEHLLAALKSEVRTRGLTEVFSFLPFKDHIWDLWFASDIAVVPSTLPEPFGMVAIEAMAAGIPVIAAGHGGLTDIVQHGVSGLLFAPGCQVALAQGIEELIFDEPLRLRLGTEGKARQQSLFSLPAQVEAITRVYESLS